MKGFEPERILGFFVGTGIVYLFFVILDLVLGKGFNTIYFFVYWDLMLFFMIVLSLVKRDMEKLEEESKIS